MDNVDERQQASELFSKVENQLRNFASLAKKENATNGVLSEETNQTAQTLKALVGGFCISPEINLTH